VLISEFFPVELRQQASAASESETGSAEKSSDLQAMIDDRLRAGSRNLYAEASEAMERVLLTTVLKNTQGNQSKAADILGITRGSLRNKIRSLGIYIDRMIHVQDDPAEDAVTSDA
jgi:two-component system nitrogen regulation response regulator GlnG